MSPPTPHPALARGLSQSLPTKDSGLTPAVGGPSREQAKRELAAMYEAPAIIGTCINCIAPGSLLATLAVIVIGIGIAVMAERRKAA
jgi:hypothetical protein